MVLTMLGDVWCRENEKVVPTVKKMDRNKTGPFIFSRLTKKLRP